MADKSRNGHPNIFPALRYKDAPAAIDWLGRAFGFEKQFVVPGENSTVAHAQLRLGAGMIMMGSGGKPDSNNPWATEKYGTYVVVKEIDAHYARAKAAGADIVRPIPTPTTAPVNIRCAIAKAICGASAPTTPTRSPER